MLMCSGWQAGWVVGLMVSDQLFVDKKNNNKIIWFVNISINDVLLRCYCVTEISDSLRFVWFFGCAPICLIWLAGCLVGWLVGWLPGWLAAWLAGSLAGWLAGRLAGLVVSDKLSLKFPKNCKNHNSSTFPCKPCYWDVTVLLKFWISSDLQDFSALHGFAWFGWLAGWLLVGWPTGWLAGSLAGWLDLAG